MKALDQIASQSRMVKLRVEVLEKPLLLMMAYIRAGREGDWRLNRATFRKMLPYYFAPGNVNYARYYLRSMEKLIPEQHLVGGIVNIISGKVAPASVMLTEQPKSERQCQRILRIPVTSLFPS